MQGRVASALLDFALGCGSRAKPRRFQTIRRVGGCVPNSPNGVFAYCNRDAAGVPEEFYRYFAFILSP